MNVWFEQFDGNRKTKWIADYVNHKHFRAELVRIASCSAAKDQTQQWKQWCADLLEEVRSKVDSTFGGVTRHLGLRLDKLEERRRAFKSDADVAKKEVAKLSAEKELSTIYVKVKELSEYSAHNFSLCLKLGELFVDEGGDEDLITDVLNDIRASDFHDAKYLTGLLTRVNELNCAFGVDALGRALRVQFQTSSEQSWHSFLAGFQFMCWIDIAALLWFPHTNPKFDWDAFANSLPVFRAGFMMCVLLWSTGLVVLVFEKYLVNYPMLLNIHPSLIFDSGSIFTLGQVQTTIFTTIFLAYLLDYKFGLLFNTESAFQMYPCLQVVLTLGLWLAPFHLMTFVGPARRALAGCLMQVFFAFLPFGHVTFAANLLGDVLTSFTKPLKDIIYSGCYLGYAVAGNSMNDTAANCRVVESNTVTMLILDLPFIFRLIQCMRRYIETREVSHLLNVGKYVASLLVSIVSFVEWKGRGWSEEHAFLIVLCTSAIATLYSLIWDLHKDWGLLPGFPTCAAFLRSKQVYPLLAYKIIACFDTVGRSTWATGLMPNQWLYSDPVGAEKLVLILSVVEILRRAVWAVLRIEHEQVANASKYRDILWMPVLSVDRNEESKALAEMADAECVTAEDNALLQGEPEFQLPPKAPSVWKAFVRTLSGAVTPADSLSVPLVENLADPQAPQHVVCGKTRTSRKLNRSKTAAAYQGVMDAQDLLQKTARVKWASESIATAMYPDAAALPKLQQRQEKSDKTVRFAIKEV